jgi:hypothetical protein
MRQPLKRPPHPIPLLRFLLDSEIIKMGSTSSDTTARNRFQAR